MLSSNTLLTRMEEEKCEVVDIWAVLGKKWSLHILKNLSINGTVRFNAIKRLIPDISSTVLSDRLLELEREGLISKKIFPQIPIKVEYSLTIRAKELQPILYQLSNWVDKWQSNKIKNDLELQNPERINKPSATKK
ncbi:MAG TPA: helix-turn-helix domain-containing protein [Candidatus Nitrosocosmicus sp.]|nr:helix-turn-helix domain-containing protein [Candidatus Nitrosocosmicus sp.]